MLLAKQLQIGGPVTDPPRIVQFTLTNDGEPVPATDVVWTSAPQNLGEIDINGRFRGTALAGEAAILAEYAGGQATALVRIQATDDVIDSPSAPEDIVDRIDQAPDGGAVCAAQWLYPSANTVIPANFTGLRFQWTRRGHDLFRLEIEVEGSTIRWFTDRDSVEPAGDQWNTIMSRAVGREMRVRLTGVGGSGAEACTTDPLVVTVDRSKLEGAVYYWSTSDSGIMRLAAGDTAPEPFLNPQTAPQITCPACHALSRDGSRIAFTRTSFPPFGDMAVSLVNRPADMLYDPTGIVGYFPTFAPDNTRILGAAAGALVVRNPDTGVELERLPMDANMVAGSPDWAWTENRVVATMGANGLSNPLPDVGITSGSLYVWQEMGDGTWSQPTLLLNRADGPSLDRPAFDPNGDLIAFNKVGNNPSQGQGMSNPAIDLWIIPSLGGTPVKLENANGGELLGNSWPKWAPTDQRGRLWLAFSSLRDYGNVLVNSGREFANPQIWVTSIDPNAPEGTDPSSPAFWLPYQSIQSGNHIPYWSAYVKD